MSCFDSDSTGARIVVSTAFETVVSVPPVQLNVTLPRLVTAGGGATTGTRAWNVTNPDVPGLIAPILTFITPLPRTTNRPASPSAASVSGMPFHLIDPATYDVPVGTVSASCTEAALSLPDTA